MTQEELNKIESELIKKGYKKYTTCLTSTETYAWFKTFDRQTDEDDEVISGYQVAFRVWDFTKYPQCIKPYGLDIWISPIERESRADLVINWEPYCNIDSLEEIAKDFYTFICKYLK